MTSAKSANYINHIVFVHDSSGSMQPHQRQVIKVADAQVAYLAQRSKELDQETRVTSYTFDVDARCIHYDKDVLRLPSLANDYSATGARTALVDATIKAIDDLKTTPELYGDHAFLIYVLTDGQDNASHFHAMALSSRIAALPDNWTVAVLVPDQNGVFEAKRYGFPAQNISVWNTTSSSGFEEAGSVIRSATDNWMTQRSQGVRGSKSLFRLDTSQLTPTAVQRTLDYLPPFEYETFHVRNNGSEIRTFVEFATRKAYRIGSSYYQITKPETIQGGKQILVRDRHTGNVFGGDNARSLLNLPDYSQRVKPSDFSQYDIFIQSTSVNRKLVPGTDLLVLKR